MPNDKSLTPALADLGGLSNLFSAPPPFRSAAGIDVVALLESIAKNPQNRVYKNETVFLDGYSFTNCCFINCVLYADTGIFALKSCTLTQDCKVLLGPAALRLVKLFNLYYPNQNAPFPVYNAVGEPHGSITVE
jgi:hypothetical protein